MSAAAFGLTVLITPLAGVAAVLPSRVSGRLRIPAPAFFLIPAVAAADVWPRLGGLSFTAVEQIVSVALAVTLFDGGMRVWLFDDWAWMAGLRRFIVAPGAAADAAPVRDLRGAEDAWISLLVRNGRLAPVRSDTIPRAGDEAVVLSSGPDVAGLSALFTAPAPNAPQPGAWRGTVRDRDHGNIRARQAGLAGGEGWKAAGGHGGDGAGGGG